jgi:hypothetical protein
LGFLYLIFIYFCTILYFYVWNYFKKIVLSKFKNITNSLLFFFISNEIKVKRRHITVKQSPPHNELTMAQKLESSQPWKTTRLQGASLTPSMPKRPEKTTRHGQKYSFHSKKKKTLHVTVIVTENFYALIFPFPFS